MSTEAPGIGDNSALYEPADIAKDAIDEALRPLWARARQLIASPAASRAVTDRDTAGAATDLDAMLSSVLASVDREHGRIKAPYLEAGNVVDGLANKLREEIRPVRDRIERTRTAWQVAEQKRIDDARAAERAAESADPEPQWAPPVPSRKAATVRGDRGAKAHLREQDVVVIYAVKKIPRSMLENEKVLAAIRSVAKPVLKAGQKVAGARLESDTRSVTTRK